MKKIIDSLNDMQKEAVLHTDGPVLVVAGAGAGKTRVIVSRILNLIHKGVSPENILAITFTNKSASEMKDRVMRAISTNESLRRPVYDQALPFISTFHSLGVHIIRNDGDKIQIPRSFTIFDRQDSVKTIKRSMKKVGVDTTTWSPNKIQSIISKKKGEGVTLNDYTNASEFSPVKKIVEQVWLEYESILKTERALDFDDLLLKSTAILKQNAQVREKYKKIWQYIHVDEYQDTNPIQYEMTKLLVGDKKNIFVVGDADQTIYTWRGADIKNILDFENDFVGAKVVLLEENYRSTKNIIRAAQDVIEKNILRKDKNLFTQNSDGEKLRLIFAQDEVSEAHAVAIKIKGLMDENSVKPKEIAVLYRTNFQSRALEEAMLRHKIQYTLVGTRFFERKEIKDIVSYIRLAMNPESVSDLVRIINVPRRGIGKVTLLKIASGQRNMLTKKMQEKVQNFYRIIEDIRAVIERDKVSNVVKFVFEKTGLKDALENNASSVESDGKERAENIKELVTFALKYDGLDRMESIEKFLEDVALASDQDSLDNKKDGVRLMTIHASKGLEFDYVFITGLEEGLFPQTRDDGTQEEQEEERRLFYVALTRARKNVFLFYTSSRTIFGSKIYNIPSEFISDISDDLIEEDGVEKLKTIYL